MPHWLFRRSSVTCRVTTRELAGRVKSGQQPGAAVWNRESLHRDAVLPAPPSKDPRTCDRVINGTWLSYFLSWCGQRMGKVGHACNRWRVSLGDDGRENLQRRERDTEVPRVAAAGCVGARWTGSCIGDDVRCVEIATVRCPTHGHVTQPLKWQLSTHTRPLDC